MMPSSSSNRNSAGRVHIPARLQLVLRQGRDYNTVGAFTMDKLFAESAQARSAAQGQFHLSGLWTGLMCETGLATVQF